MEFMVEVHLRIKQIYMKKHLLSFALAIFTTAICLAQSSAALHGKVLDEKGEPIVGAVVRVTAGAAVKGDQTDLDGKFRIKPLTAGRYTVRFEATGKTSVTITNVLVDHELITFMKDVVMPDSTFTIGGLEIVGSTEPPLISVDIAPIMFRSKDLIHLPAANGGSITQMAAALSSDIKPDPNGTDLYVRGSRAGSVLYFIDGVKVREGGIRMPSSGISSIGVYTGALPAKYGDTTGGVIVVETKNYLEDYYRKLNR
jgi:hypothetical protein